MWKNKDEMFVLMKEKLYMPVVGDILDVMGYSHQFLLAAVQPLRDDMKVAGKACTILECNVYQVQRKPFGLLTEALGQLEESEVYTTTGAHNSAMWEEILIATARVRRAVGAVLDGYTRDTPQVLEQNFPVFTTGCWAQDSSIHTNVIGFRCTIEIGSVIIHNDDLVFGDMDGALITPKEAAVRCIEDALKEAVGEKQVRKVIENDMPATEAFHKFGIL